MPITKEQQKFLKSRLEVILSDKPGRWDKVEIPDTAAVKKARLTLESANKIIAGHEKKMADMTKARKTAISKMYTDCGQIIQFGNPETAIKALDNFEATKF